MKVPSVVLLEWRLYKRAERYSLGLNYIHAALKNSGFNTQTFLFEGVSIEKACEDILAADPDIVGIKFYSETSVPTFEIARKLKEKKPQIKIAIGGHTATLYGALILKQEPSIDIVVSGEGELTFIELCERIQNNQSLSDCQGIIYREGDTIFRNQPRGFIKDLDTAILPDSSVFEDSKDPSSWFVQYAISTARGCTGNCYFCVINRVYEEKGKKQWRGMSPEKIVDELEQASLKFSNKQMIVKFVDSAFEDPDPKTKKRLRRIIQLIGERHLNIAFSFFTRAESWSSEDEDLIIEMKKAGLYKISLGLDESIKPYAIRDFTRKALCQENKQVSKLFERNGVQPYGYLILFHPFITMENLEESAIFLDEIGMSPYPDVWTHEVTLYPDTRLFSHVVSSGLLLGTDSEGYSYKYGYEDGRVTKMQAVIHEVKELTSFRNIRSSMLKVDMDFDVYNAWSGRMQEMQVIKDEMDTYKSKVLSLYKELGNRQRELFLEAVSIIKQGRFNSNSWIVEAWDQVFSEKQGELEKMWLQNRLQIGRKKVRLN
ncbi:MAG TPA: radical SAM protein [Pseudobacteroides sp.]|uniref:B12-binding domain-containing radical SAM protein n=1 Tax=Pseudobacteroides sp. TaxID=1968840 RepID=UPI002F928F20